MNNEEAIVNLVRLMTSFHLEIKALPDDLKCVKCKYVLKNGYQMPCGCRFCRACIDDVISSGDPFCPGSSQKCGTTPLSNALPDYRANKNILKLIAKCPRAGCMHECPLADMEGHIRVCSNKNIDCPFREFGCEQGALPIEEMRGHSEILIGTVADISRDVEMLKRELLMKDEQGRHLENEMKLIINQNKSIKNEIKSVKDKNESMKEEMKSIISENKSINDVNKLVKLEIKSVKEENKAFKDEMKSMKIENKSIKLEKEVLGNQVRQLSEKLELVSAMVTVVTGAVASNRDEMKSVKDNMRSMKDCTKCQMESIQMTAGLGQLDYWLIKENLVKTTWGWHKDRSSGEFGLGHAFELWSKNSDGILIISLRIWVGPSACLLQWPFTGELTITVADTGTGRREAFSRQTRPCYIARPKDNQYSQSDSLGFRHFDMWKDGLNLERGVQVSCRIEPGAGQ